MVRFPPYHCIFNPIELIWSQMKNNIRRNNVTPKFSSATIDIIKEEAVKITAETVLLPEKVFTGSTLSVNGFKTSGCDGLLNYNGS